MIICGTGHRPDKLFGYDEQAFYDLTDIAYDYLKDNRPEGVVAGGAIGWDQALAHAAYQLEIPLVLAYPFEGFESKWPKDSVGRRFHNELEVIMRELPYKEVERIYVSEPGYAPWKMQVRNKWMVDKTDMVLALWNGTDGGTANCVRYAHQKQKPVVNLWEAFEKAREQRQA